MNSLNMKSSIAQEIPVRVAWLFPSLARAFYWHPVLAELTKLYPEMVVFTGYWPGFAKQYDKSFSVKEVGKFKFIRIKRSSSGYDRGFIIPSLKIVPSVLEFRPKVIIAVAFSLWTFLVLLLKPWTKWKMVIFYEGDSPTIGGSQRGMRRFWRSLIARYTDAFITNSGGGRKYLVDQLGIGEDRVFVKPCEVPDPTISFHIKDEQSVPPMSATASRPVFLFIGQLIERKGISYLLDACRLLKSRGYTSWSLLIVGDGQRRPELVDYTRSMELDQFVHWMGWIRNENLGSYFRSSDVFVFPTLEDTWGVAVLEAMLFEKPILCSKFAGASEMIRENENGFVFDPHRTERFAELMGKFIEDPFLIKSMGRTSKQLIEPFTPEATAKHLAQVIEL